MTFTKIIPTDRNGNVNFGPTTYKEAQQLFDDATQGLSDKEEIKQQQAIFIFNMLKDTGHTGVANKFKKNYIK